MFLRNLTFIVSVCFLMKIKLTTGTVTFEHHAYQIDVAIGEKVPYDSELIKWIKETFTEGSKVLFKATYQKAYFGQVNVWFPPTWSIPKGPQNVNVSLKVNDNWFEDADLRLEQEPHPIHGDHPYTLQPRGCGEPGLYMHFTTNFLKNPQKHGNRGRVLVHEWAHYRYGVFNEYSDADDVQFYLNTNKSIKPTLCSSHVKGWFIENGNQSCTKDSNGYPTKKCSFYPDKKSNANENVTASLMSVPYLKNVEFFCNDEQHNEVARTTQNELCNQSSTWSIINSHPDFKNLNASTNISKTFPVFHFFQSKRPKRKQAVVALVDMSDTMKEKLETVKDSLKSFVKYRLPGGIQFAVLGFSSLYDRKGELYFTKIFQNFTNVEQQTEILQNIDRMSVNTPSQSSNSRPTGYALNSSLNYIQEQLLHNPANASVLLITDGPTTYGQYVFGVIPKLIEAELQVNFVTLGFDIQPDLKEKIAQTSGELYSVEVAKDNSTIKLLHQLDSVFMQVASRIGSEHVTPLRENTITLSNGKPLNGSFVAETIGQTFETDVFVCAKEKKQFTLIIWNATKVLVYRNSSSCHFTRVRVVGKMLYSLNYTKTEGYDNLTLSMVISSRCPKYQVTPDQVIRHRYIPPITVYPAVPKAYLILTKGSYAPIVKAEVNFTACSTGPVSNSCQIFQLRDDGKGIDNFANDGVYSAVTNYIKNNGSYSTSFTFGKVSGTRLIRHKKIPRTGAPILPELPVENIPGEARDSVDPDTLAQAQDEPIPEVDDDDETEWVDAEWVDDFLRERSTGYSQAPSYMAVDNIKPAYVRDLKVTGISLSKAKSTHLVVSLEWTSSGDDEFEGIADFIEIRYAYSPNLRQNFENGILIITGDLQEGLLNPQQPRTKHSLKMQVKSGQQDESTAFVTYFVVQTWDKARNCEKSNVAMSYLKIVHTNTLIVTGTDISSGTLTLLAVFGIIFILGVSLAIVKIVRCQQDRSHIKDKDTDNDLDSNFYTSKGNTYTNYSSDSAEETEAAAQAAAVAQVIEKATKKRGKKNPFHQSNSLLTVDETRL